MVTVACGELPSTWQQRKPNELDLEYLERIAKNRTQTQTITATIASRYFMISWHANFLQGDAASPKT